MTFENKILTFVDHFWYLRNQIVSIMKYLIFTAVCGHYQPRLIKRNVCRMTVRITKLSRTV